MHLLRTELEHVADVERTEVAVLQRPNRDREAGDHDQPAHQRVGVDDRRPARRHCAEGKEQYGRQWQEAVGVLTTIRIYTDVYVIVTSARSSEPRWPR